MIRSSRAAAAAVASLLTAALLTACGSNDDALVIYNAQHERLLEEVVAAFTEETGIEVVLRNGSDLELANQLLEEGDASEGDVFLTENSPAMTVVQSAGLFSPLGESVTANIPDQYRPDDNSWTGFAARSTVLQYNLDEVAEADLPASILDLADPEWAGRLTLSPTGADFQAIVAAVLALEGKDATRAWLEGLKANGTPVDGNNVVLQTVDDGEHEVGITYHYYWYRDAEENGDNSDGSALHYFGNQDPGAFLSISGAGILANGNHGADAEAFLDFLTGPEGQAIVSESYALEYPLNPDVDIRTLPALDTLEAPEVDVSDLDSVAVVELMQETGFL